MIRLLITFFVLLSSSFVGGSNQLSQGVLSSFNHLQLAAIPERGNLQTADRQTIQNTSIPGAESDVLNATEIEEDDDVESFRKHIEVSDYFFNYSPAQVSTSVNCYLKDRLPTCKRFSYLLSNRYIVYRVIRV